MASIRARRPLLAILFVAAVLRVFWLWHESRVVEGDECEYLRLAENLVATHRYVGLFEGPELIYPPLFPILVAAVAQVTSSYPAAGEVVSFVAGMWLVWGVFLLARNVYGTRVGLVAAILAACHPALIELSGAIYSESVYLPLVVGGLFFGLRWLESEDRGSALWSGVCFGCAYLTRPEALLYPLVVAAAFVWKGCAERRWGLTRLASTLPLLATVAALAAPYVVYLSVHTGGLRVEGKSVMNYTIAQRLNGGVDVPQATLGISADLREEGPFLSPNRWILQAPHAIALPKLAEYWIPSARRNSLQLEKDLLSPAIGSVLGAGLLALGLIGQPWQRRRFMLEAVTLTIVIGYVAILLGQHYVSFRYVMPLVPFLIVWGANGIDVAGHWFAATARNLLGDRRRAARRLALVGRCALIVAALLGIRTLTWDGFFRGDDPGVLEFEKAGLWLAKHRPGPKTVMSANAAAPYYAAGSRMAFPAAEADRALAYLREKAPDFIVLTSGPTSLGQYYRDWFAHGIPDPAAHLIHRIGPARSPHAMIFEWRPS
jgi:hypothetical protein